MSDDPVISLADMFRLLGEPHRIQILLVIGCEEACVCHLVAALGIRQAALSQHLITLRKAGLVTTCRVGRNIFYRLKTPHLYEAVCQFASMAGITTDAMASYNKKPLPNCPCPYCCPQAGFEKTC